MSNILEVLTGWDPPKLAALLNRLGGPEIAEAILRGEMEVTEAVQALFDRHGRRIPPRGLQQSVVDANRDFRIEAPQVDYTKRLFRLHMALGLTQFFMQPEEFERRSKAVLARIGADQRMANRLKSKGVHLPFALPLMPVADYGQTLDKVLLPAVGRSYGAQFPERKFCNNRADTLAGQVTIVEASRHNVFLQKLVKGSVVGVYFPALQGFSIPAAVEQMATLPDECLLAGALDTAAVEIMYPDVVACGWNTPGLDCAAVSLQSGDSLSFGAYDGRLVFFRRSSHADVLCAGGLVLLG